MRLLITGSRNLNWHYYPTVRALIKKYYPEATEIWHGDANGCDQLAERYAQEMAIPTRAIRPDYKALKGRWAPLVRNTALVAATDCTLAIYANELTPGTRDAATKSRKAGHPTVIVSAVTLLTWEAEQNHGSPYYRR